MKIEVNTTCKFVNETEFRKKVRQLMKENNVKKTDIAVEFKKRGIIGNSYPTILKKLADPVSFQWKEICVLCNILECNLSELLIKKQN